MSAGANHNLGIKTNGTLWAWGRDNYRQLGDGTTTFSNSLSPVQIGAGTNWSIIEAGDLHSLGIKTDGTLWAWGNNNTVQLGDGTITARITPVHIGTGTSWANISTGDLHSLGIKTDGTLWAWGRNYYGQLGIGTTTDQKSPLEITIKPNPPSQYQICIPNFIKTVTEVNNIYFPGISYVEAPMTNG